MKSDLKSKPAAPAARRTAKTIAKTAKTKDSKSEAPKTGKPKAKTGKQTAGAKVSEAGAKATGEKAAKGPTARRSPSKRGTAGKIFTPRVKTASAKAAKAAPGRNSGGAKRSKKAKAGAEKGVKGYGIGEPVLDPIGDATDGEGRTSADETEAQAGPKQRDEDQAEAEMEAFRVETAIDALDSALEAGPGMEAALRASEARARVEAQKAAAEGEGAANSREAGLTNEQGRPNFERLQKILSQAGIASRRHAEEMIVAGRVMVNGQIVTRLGAKADPARDHIRVDGKLVTGAERHRYFVLNKPRGYVTTVSDPEGRPTVMQFFAKMHERLYPVGRLDYQSEGLLLMTNDGALANLVTKAGSQVEKTYLVKAAGQPTEEELERLRGGVEIERGEAGSERLRTAPARIRQVREGENPWFEVVLTEGRNRELRKMFAAVGHFAEKIRRVGYGPLVLDVEPGKWRELTAEEVTALRLTAEGKMKPRRMNAERVLPKEAGKPAEQQRRFAERRGRGEKPRWQREDRVPRGDWDPRKREFGARRDGRPARSEDRKDWKPRGGKFDGEGRRPEFGDRAEGTRGRDGGRGFGGERREEKRQWRPRSEEFHGEPRSKFRSGPQRERNEGRFERPERRGFRGDRGEEGARGSDGGRRFSGERPRLGSSERPAFDRGEREPFRKRGGEGERRTNFAGGREGGPKRKFQRGPKLGAKPGGFGNSRGGKGRGLGGDRSRDFGGSKPGWKPGAARGGRKRG